MTTTPKFANVGLGYIIMVNRVIGILPPTTQTARRWLDRAKNMDLYIDASRGRKIRSVICAEDGVVWTSAISPMTLLKRFSEETANYSDKEALEKDMEDFVLAEEEDVD